MAAANKTIDHDEIKRWVESHGGHPATVKSTRSKGDVGMIRIDFPGFSGEDSLQAISWDEWFSKFDEQELAFIYQQGKRTNFNKLVRRDPQKARPSDRRRGPSRTTRGGRAAATALAAERSQRATRSKARSASKSSASTNGRGASTRSAAGGERTNGAKRQSARAGQNTPRRGASRGGKSSARKAELSELTKAELYEMARSSGVEQRSTMSKSELIRALERQRR
jgi:hypothetical protein